MANRSPGPFAGADHDHGSCVAEALQAAEDLCRTRGVRLTNIRRSVLELVWQSHRPIGAYAILEGLQQRRGGPVAPPTVYRALDFLLEQRLIHRVESLNAFVGCDHPGEQHAPQFLICSDCGRAAELDSQPLLNAIGKAADRAGFAVDHVAVEVSGQCPECYGGRRGANRAG